MGRTLEFAWRLWNDDTGERIEVCPDADGLDLVEIRQVDSDGKVTERTAFPREVVPALIEMLGHFAPKEQADAERS